MSRILRELLDAKEPQFSLSLRQLEASSGRQGADARLIGDIARKMGQGLRHIGLDPIDSTDKEIYHAMLAHVARDNARLCSVIGASDPDDAEDILPHVVKAVEEADIPKRCWALKRSVAKRLLKKMPPRGLMKQLGYRSVDSMLKHEPIDELYTAIRFSEGDAWLVKYNELFASVRPSDFEERQVSIVIMDKEKYGSFTKQFFKKKLHAVAHTKEMATIALLPPQAKRVKGATLTTMSLVLHYVNEIRVHSAFFKLKQVNRTFGEIVASTLTADFASTAQLAGQQLHWRVVQRYYGKPGTSYKRASEVFEPHIHTEDLYWRHAEDNLAVIDPGMKFWVEMGYVGRMASDGQPLTFNMTDVCMSYTNDRSYEQRYSYHFQESLWNEIFARYMGSHTLEEGILQQLNTDMVAPDALLGRYKEPRPVAPKSASESLSAANRKKELLVRKRLIDAAEGRMVGVVAEFEKAFAILQKFDRTVTIFGSARLSQDSLTCQNAYVLAHRFASEGYGVVTGGGLGVMEAANHGAYDAKKGGSVGFNIHLPTEQHLNAYTTDNYEFKHFFGRKVALTLDADGYVYFPGGFGTMDELFEIATLLQTGIVPPVPIVLFDSAYWKPLMKYILTTFDKKYATIDHDDPELFFVTDDLEEAFAIINNKTMHLSQVDKVRHRGGTKAKL